MPRRKGLDLAVNRATPMPLRMGEPIRHPGWIEVMRELLIFQQLSWLGGTKKATARKKRVDERA
jgi:hypothetical protein